MKHTSLVLCLWLGFQMAASAQQPQEAEMQFNTGLGHLRDGRPDLAVEAFKQSLRKDAKNPYAYKGLGQAYLMQQKYQQAADAFHKALEINPYFTDVRNDLGIALLYSGKYDEARQQLSQAYNDATNPTPEITAWNTGESYLMQKDYEKALSWFDLAIQRNNKLIIAYLSAADVLALTNRLEAATARLEAAQALAADDLRVLLALGEAYFRAGRFSEARKKLDQVSSKDPKGALGRRASEMLKDFPK